MIPTGARDKILENPRQGNYKGLEIITGITELNLREVNRNENTKGIFLMYLGDSRKEGTESGQTNIINNKLSISLLLENSIVTASYINEAKDYNTWAWAHNRIPGSSLYRYPESELEVKKCFLKTAREFGLKTDRHCRTLNSIPPLLMLAADAYTRVKNLN